MPPIRQTSPLGRPAVAAFACTAALACTAIPAETVAADAAACHVVVTDRENGWPVPLVELRTTHGLRFFSDNAGRIALDAPELFGREVWFGVHGHGYGVAADGFGYEGVRLTPTPGGHLEVKVDRRSIAKRLGRLTGAGIFSESQQLGLEPDWTESGVFGCDSVQIASHRGKLFWAWGDTTLPGYPLGIFHMSSATTPLRPLSSFDPPVRLDLEYFRGDDGRPRGVAKMPGDGPTWISGYTSVPDRDGSPRLVATYAKIEPPLATYELGLCVWDDEANRFERHRVVWERGATGGAPPDVPDGHPARWTDPGGQEWLLFGDPFPRLRCRPTFEAWGDPNQWVALEPQASVPVAATEGGTPAVKPHRGSIAWNAFRQRWVTVFTQHFGDPSPFGEIWYAEAPAPTGPWGSAIKVLTHDNYTFYNPRLHPELTPADSPILLFEGTFTHTFADRPHPVPRADYNQVLYRIDLDDPELAAIGG